MAKWTIVYNGSQIGKDGVFYENLDLSFLPSDVLAVQSSDGITANIEKGDRATETHTSSEESVQTSSLSWWGDVSTVWEAADNLNSSTKLSALSLSSGTLSPSFNQDVFTYAASVSNDVTSVTVTATPIDSGSTVSVLGGSELIVGENPITVTLRKPGSPNNDYDIVVTRSS
jgi:hypothetical protein